jgi:hypothetical protein
MAAKNILKSEIEREFVRLGAGRRENRRPRLAVWRKHRGPSEAPAWPALKFRKIDTTDRPLIAAELERKPATISA